MRSFWSYFGNLFQIIRKLPKKISAFPKNWPKPFGNLIFFKSKTGFHSGTKMKSHKPNYKKTAILFITLIALLTASVSRVQCVRHKNSYTSIFFQWNTCFLAKKYMTSVIHIHFPRIKSRVNLTCNKISEKKE